MPGCARASNDWIAICMNLKRFLLPSVAFAFILGGAETSGAVENAATAPAPIAARGFTVEKLADGIYAAIRTDPPGLMVDANSLFIVNDNDVVVVCANGSCVTPKFRPCGKYKNSSSPKLTDNLGTTHPSRPSLCC